MNNKKKRRNIEESAGQKNKWKVICLIMLVVMVVIYYQVFGLVKYTFGENVTESQIWLYRWAVGNISKEGNNAIETTIDIAVLGNIKAKGVLIDSYSEKGIVDYNTIFKYLSFKEYDYTIANLNTSIVLDTKPEGKFYANVKLLKELNNININMLITATKELAEQKEETIKETLEELTKYDMKYVGTKKNSKNNYYILNKNNIKIGILAYVDEDYSRNDNLNIYSKKVFKQDVSKIKKEGADAIIVFIDTLRNKESKAEEEKNVLLQEILDMGADIVISSDEVEQKLYKSTDNTKYIKYSLGDLLGPQEDSKTDISRVLKISIGKKTLNHKTTLDIKVNNDKTLVALSNADKTKYKIVDLDKEILEFNELSDKITMAEYNYLKQVKENIDNATLK